MGKLGGIILLASLALTGCAAPQANVHAVSSVLPAEPDPANPATYSSAYSADEFFIVGVKMGWQGKVPTNTTLVNAGMKYCEDKHAGTDANSRRIATYAKVTFCP